MSCSPFLLEKVLLPQQKQGSHGGRRPAPWPCSNEAVGNLPSMAIYFISFTCLDRGGKTTPFHVSVWKEQKELSSTKGENMVAGFSLTLSRVGGRA